MSKSALCFCINKMPLVTKVCHGSPEIFLSSQSMKTYCSVCVTLRLCSERLLTHYWELQLTHSYSPPLISPLTTSFLSPLPLPFAPSNPTSTPTLTATPSLPLSFSAWMFGREGGWSCRPVLYIRCQASDRDSGLWVNTLTASTEDILLVKWSLHYFRWKETQRQEEKAAWLFHNSPPMEGIVFIWN